MNSHKVCIGLIMVALGLSNALFGSEAQGNPFSMEGPKGWGCIDDKTQLPGKVDLVYIGAGKTGQFTPSINLATEVTEMTITEYTALAKNYHETQANTTCSYLGTITTQAGVAELLQIDRKTQWGVVRFLQAMLIDKGKAYVLTATCLQEDFSNLYSQFFQTMQSFSFCAKEARKNSLSALPSVEQKKGKRGRRPA